MENETVNYEPHAVACPEYVKRKMRRNLTVASRCKLNRSRAQKATDILAMITEEPRLAEAQPKPAVKADHAGATKSVSQVADGTVSAAGKKRPGLYRRFRAAIREFRCSFRSGTGTAAVVSPPNALPRWSHHRMTG